MTRKEQNVAVRGRKEQIVTTFWRRSKTWQFVTVCDKFDSPKPALNWVCQPRER